ncbi:hypothetical protein [Micromonospora sp. CB01531]|uniref:hypothetical protein n=1 Tax=Micromonospora sp. CB01531 TaxID=1718947 RepID=UPI00093A6DAE|nr:hypothetical protein [Micromonospora sp. CB01531]OKI52869.1 hypothetical protein A6A27_08250 [Micromonospora sp. CB01531]
MAHDRLLARTKTRIALLRAAAAGDVTHDCGEGSYWLGDTSSGQSRAFRVTARAEEQLAAEWIRIGPALHDQRCQHRVEPTELGRRTLADVDEQAERFLDR